MPRLTAIRLRCKPSGTAPRRWRRRSPRSRRSATSTASSSAGVANAGPLLFDPLRAALAEHTGLAYLSGLRVLPAELGDNAGLIGAATLAGS
ncbi:putative glucokinase [Mycobacterium xenopi 3993]|nr:putative glucokinase [Mycobacterium xenopi 3993]